MYAAGPGVLGCLCVHVHAICRLSFVYFTDPAAVPRSGILNLDTDFQLENILNVSVQGFQTIGNERQTEIKGKSVSKFENTDKSSSCAFVIHSCSFAMSWFLSLLCWCWSSLNFHCRYPPCSTRFVFLLCIVLLGLRRFFGLHHVHCSSDVS